MCAIRINFINPLFPQSYFTEPLEFEIDFDCLKNLESELEWNVHIVMQNPDYDTHLDRILMEPISVGRHLFNLRVDPLEYNEIPQEEWIKTMIIVITCKYKNQECFRVGYFVHHEYSEEIETSSCAYNDCLNPNLVKRRIVNDYPYIMNNLILKEE